MASGFILANQRGIAVSMDTMETNSRGEKYRGVNRIFPLGGRHKVVVVSRGFDKFMNIPVELLIQRFAHQLDSKPLDALGDYTIAFLNFLGSKSKDLGLNDDWYINDSVKFIFNDLYSIYNHFLQQYGRQSSFEEIFDQAVAQLDQRWQPQSDSFQMSSITKEKFTDQYHNKIIQASNEWVKGLMNYGPNTALGNFARQLQQPSRLTQQNWDILANEYSRIFDAIFHIMTYQLRGNYASIFFIGMGGTEYFGSSQLLNIYGYLQNPLASFNSVKSIDQTNEQLISSVSTYLEQSAGAELLQDGLASTSFQQIEQILKENGMKLEDMDRVLGAARRSMDNHNQGIRETITNLSPNELARLSRTMVEVNSFVSRFLFPDVRVGGDIETVIVTYQDGVVWLHRQQNIDYQLNPSLLHRHDNPEE